MLGGLKAVVSKTTIKSLDAVQSQFLRLVCGGMSSTPSAACETDVNVKVESLDLRRERTVIESVER